MVRRARLATLAAIVAALVLGSPLPGSAWRATPLPAAPLVTEQRRIEVPDSRFISMSPDGRLFVAAKPQTGYGHGQLCVYAVATATEQACADLSGLGAGLRIEDVAWSADASHLAFAEDGLKYFRDGDLWVMATASGTLTDVDDDGFSGDVFKRLASEPSDQPVSLPVNPAFSPDGRTIAFSRSVLVGGRFVGNEIAVVPVAGGTPRTLTRVTLDVPGVVYFGIRWAPDASRLYYSVHYPSVDDPHNGIWVVDADGFNQRHLIGSTDANAGAPAVIQVSSRGDRLLAYYPLVQLNPAGTRLPIYALVDVATGSAAPLAVPEAKARPGGAFVSLAALSPDGSKVLMVTRRTDPDNAVWIRDVAGGTAIQTGEPLASAGALGPGMIPTWATDGSVLISGGSDLGGATLLRIAGSAVPASIATPASTPGAMTFAPGAAVREAGCCGIVRLDRWVSRRSSPG